MSSRSGSPGEPAPLGRRRLTELLDRHGIRPSRALGQNFLVDPNTAGRIVRLADLHPGARVAEIGAGLGSLTTELLAAGAVVTAVELDRRLVAALEEELAADVGAGRLRLVHGDALTLDWADVLDGTGWRVVANLPYNVATPLVVTLLETAPAVERMLVMVQREVGERMAARPGDPAYGAVSVKVAYWATAAVAGRVPATVFLPRPRVESVLVAFARRAAPAVDPATVAYGRLTEVVNAGFSQRRKMLRSSLAGVVSTEAFEAAGVAPTRRAEELDVEAWGRLARLGTPGPPE